MTATPTAHTRPPATPVRRPWSGGRTALVVAGAILAMFGVGSLAGGGLALWADQQRDSDGFLTSGPGRFTTDSYAITAPSVHVNAAGPDVLYDEGMPGEARIQLRPTEAGTSLFVGVGAADDVAAYLDTVNHDEVSDLDTGPFEASYTRHPGGEPATDPAAQTFWVASDSGTGPRTVTWPIAAGDWAVVIMNTDGSAGIQADVTAGAKVQILGTTAVVALVLGALLLVAGSAMIVAPLATRGPRRQPTAGSGIS